MITKLLLESLIKTSFKNGMTPIEYINEIEKNKLNYYDLINKVNTIDLTEVFKDAIKPPNEKQRQFISYLLIAKTNEKHFVSHLTNPQKDFLINIVNELHITYFDTDLYNDLKYQFKYNEQNKIIEDELDSFIKGVQAEYKITLTTTMKNNKIDKFTLKGKKIEKN